MEELESRRCAHQHCLCAACEGQTAPSCKWRTAWLQLVRSVHHMSSSRNTRAPEGARLGGRGCEGPPALIPLFPTSRTPRSQPSTTTISLEQQQHKQTRPAFPASLHGADPMVLDHQVAPLFGFPGRTCKGVGFSWKRPLHPPSHSSSHWNLKVESEGSGLPLVRTCGYRALGMVQQKVRRIGVPVGITSILGGLPSNLFHVGKPLFGYKTQLPWALPDALLHQTQPALVPVLRKPLASGPV